MDIGAWWATVHRVAKSPTQLGTNTHVTNVQTFKNSQIQLTCPFILWIAYESIPDSFTYYIDAFFVSLHLYG